MNRQPALWGETLYLRPLREADREALYSVASDPGIWALHPAHDRWQRAVFDGMFDDALVNEGALAVVERQSERIIGSSQFRESAQIHGAIEIGWTFLARAYWGGTINRELKRLMLSHVFASVDLAVFRVGAENWRSRRAVEKIGGELLDLTQDVPFPDGRTVTHVFYGIDRARFSATLRAT